MNVTTVRSIALSFFIALGEAASPSERTSEDLVNDCRAVGESLDSAQSYRCIYYIRGFLDAKYLRQPAKPDRIVHLPFGSRTGRIPSDRNCLDAKIAVEEIVKILLDFAQNGPEKSTTTAAELLEGLLAAHYPCDRHMR